MQETKGIQKRKKGIETTNRILEQAARLFARKGFDSVSMNEIASAVGIKESSLYNHFSGKAAILGALFEEFAAYTPSARPSEAELENMLDIMEPEEIFKNILVHFASHVKDVHKSTAMVINNEKFKNAQAAHMYEEYVVGVPAQYYERLISRMIARGMVRAVDARAFAQQYNYVSIALTKEHFMADNGLADKQRVTMKMVESINFFCGLMRK